MNNIDLMNYWIEGSDESHDTMLYMYDGKRYTWSLFHGHLVIEKLIKALIAKHNPKTPHAPKSHNLQFLAQKCNLELDETNDRHFERISKFNIDSRYEDYKKEFYKICTKDFATEQIKIIEELREWLKEELKKP